MDSCTEASIVLKVIPAYDELLASNYSPQIRDVDIDDLLRREPVQLNSDAISTLIAGRTVMVTGAVAASARKSAGRCSSIAPSLYCWSNGPRTPCF